ncbi:amidohydrolase family protein [Mucilaginibacter sp. X5P1]|uniref:amidohydrolase family protein n=1 Tax=Mucilaginibacter sp. X5P1 TaxID=2723088 RepID=UPI00160945AE|nr:amidohydrolase family protein [Mucilaginibacter sp. X5P1]MBB6140577.1 imidazolonepropionase-like amidohydrolase [Mucilaginibacter sp. X5P1]
MKKLLKGIGKTVITVFFCLVFSCKLYAQSAYPYAIQAYISYKQDTIALTHCYFGDVIHKTVLSDETIVIAHGIIISTGKTKVVHIPPGATIIDCTGKTVLPGYVLLHEHMFYPDASISPYYIHYKQLPVSFPRLYFACGVTTARTAGSVEPYSDLSLKKEIDAHQIIGPTLYVTAPYMEGAGGFAPQMHEITTTEEAKRFVNFWADEGFTSFKAYMNLNRAVLKAAIDAAHARGLKITGHLCAVTYREAAEMGIDQLEHGFFAATDFIPGKGEDACVSELNPFKHINPRGKEIKDLINILVKNKVILTSTLAVFEGLCKQDTIPKQQAFDAMSPDTRDMYLKYYSHEKSADMDSAMTKELVMEKEFAGAGGLLTAGTDPTGNGNVLAGYGSLRAIELLTKAGFTAIEAIRIATYNGAVALQAQSTIGSLEVGKHADMVVIDGNVADNINNIEKVQFVFKDGVGFNAQKILQQLKGQVGKF